MSNLLSKGEVATAMGVYQGLTVFFLSIKKNNVDLEFDLEIFKKRITRYLPDKLMEQKVEDIRVVQAQLDGKYIKLRDYAFFTDIITQTDEYFDELFTNLDKHEICPIPIDESILVYESKPSIEDEFKSVDDLLQEISTNEDKLRTNLALLSSNNKSSKDNIINNVRQLASRQIDLVNGLKDVKCSEEQKVEQAKQNYISASELLRNEIIVLEKSKIEFCENIAANYLKNVPESSKLVESKRSLPIETRSKKQESLIKFLQGLKNELEKLSGYRNNFLGRFFCVPAKGFEEKRELISYLTEHRIFKENFPDEELEEIFKGILQEIKLYHDLLCVNSQGIFTTAKSRYLNQLENYFSSCWPDFKNRNYHCVYIQITEPRLENSYKHTVSNPT